MSESDLREEQAPLKERYEEEPDAAKITLTAAGEQHDDVPVGFEDIRLNLTVAGEVDDETEEAIRTYTEKYCVVYQTLENPPGVETDWTFE